MKPAILIRCDASSEVGLGHLMRCLALGGAMRDEGVRVEFAMHAPSETAASTLTDSDFVLHRLDGETGGFDATAVNKLTTLMHERGIPTILVDHYLAEGDFFSSIGREASLVCAIDDQATRRFEGVGWLLNPNAGVAVGEYNIDANAELLIGPQYALLRPEFAKLRTERTSPTEGPTRYARILVQFGGGRTDGLCARAVEWLQAIEQPCDVRCIMVDDDAWNDADMQAGHHEVTVLRNAPSIATHMQWADFSIGAGGSTCWELCCLGVPMIVGELSPDQSRIVELLDENGAAINLGWWSKIDSHNLVNAVRRLMTDPQHRQCMSRAGMALVDGQGAMRASRSLMNCMTQSVEIVA